MVVVADANIKIELGIEGKLREMGVKQGDRVRILDWYFDCL